MGWDPLSTTIRSSMSHPLITTRWALCIKKENTGISGLTLWTMRGIKNSSQGFLLSKTASSRSIISTDINSFSTSWAKGFNFFCRRRSSIWIPYFHLWIPPLKFCLAEKTLPEGYLHHYQRDLHILHLSLAVRDPIGSTAVLPHAIEKMALHWWVDILQHLIKCL